MKLRDLWLTIHRWLGLGFGVFFCIAALSGAVLVYEQEIDGWINGSAYVITDGDVGAERIITDIEQAGDRVLMLRWPQLREPLYTAEITGADGNRTVRFDPGSGRIAERTRATVPLLLLIRRMHTNLMVGRPGYFVVLGASALALISLATGVVLWWPGIRRIHRSFHVRIARGFYPFNFDFHQVVGALTLPLLVVMTLTGVLLGFGSATERLVRLAIGTDNGIRSWEQVSVAETATGGAGALTLLSAARQAAPGLEPVMLRVPDGAAQAASVHLLRHRIGTAGATVEVLLDPSDAEVLQVRDPMLMSRSSRLAHDLVFNLHIGAVGGPVVRALYSIACVAGGALFVTGLLIWWLKRRRIDAVSLRESNRVAAGA